MLVYSAYTTHMGNSGIVFLACGIQEQVMKVHTLLSPIMLVFLLFFKDRLKMNKSDLTMMRISYILAKFRPIVV